MTVRLDKELLITCACGAHLHLNMDDVRPGRIDFGRCSACGRPFTLLLTEHGLTVKPGGVG